MIRTFCTNKIRESESLNGSDWMFSPDSGQYRGQHFPIVVPGCWESLPAFSNYRGSGCYSRLIEAAGNIRLVFKGVSHTADIYLDGEHLAHHYNAYTAFSAIALNVPSGEHKLEVRVDNSFSEESALHVPNDYYSYGGISRGVVLEHLEDAFIEYLHVIPQKTAAGWDAAVTVRVRNLSSQTLPTTLCCEVAGQACSEPLVLPANGTTQWTQTYSFTDVAEWDIEAPNLHYLSAELSDTEGTYDDLIERFGFREILTEGKDLLLNGKKLRIKGFCRHEDHPMFGCALPLQAIAQDIEIVKDLGGNAIRTVHYPNDELFLDLCDEQGILVWEENHARGLSEEQMRTLHFEEQAEQVIREMINDHFNHPSIFIWGILNECASETVFGRSCYEKQFDLIQHLDTSRPWSTASCKMKDELCLDLSTVISYNIYPEWYVPLPTGDFLADLYDWVQTQAGGQDKPFLITEVGAGAVYGYRNPAAPKWSEEYQRQALEAQISAIFAQDGCSGIFIWQLTDVKVSSEWFANRPRSMNNKGVVDEYRRGKLAYDTVQKLFREQPSYVE